MALPAPAADAVLSVSELTARIRDLLGASFGEVWVRGELGRVTYHGSGHVYLSLKDEASVLEAAIWRSTAMGLCFRLEEGQEVLVLGSIDVYAPRGSYKLIVRRVEPLGEGALRLAFEQLKRRLAAQGLFDPARKRPLPTFPRRIAVVTSRTGAAVRDLVTVIHRRLPSVTIVLVPVRVQGEGAAAEIAAAIARADRDAQADVLVVGRGGGSLEDLWAFNEEVVARAIAAAATPVVSAVGHETDVTIADLVADVRAATPSHAGELVVPSREELRLRLAQGARRLERALRRRVDLAWQGVEAVAERPVLADPLRLLARRRERLDHLAARLAAQSPRAALSRQRATLATLAARLGGPLTRRTLLARRRLDDLGGRAGAGAARRLARAEASVSTLDDRLRALSPLAVLARGYALVTDAAGRVVRRGADLAIGDRLSARIADGSRVDSRVEALSPPVGDDV